MKKIVGFAAAWLSFAGPAMAQTSTTYQLTDSALSIHQIHSFTCLTSQLCQVIVPIDFTGNPFGVSGNPFYVAPAVGATFPVSGSVAITGTLPAFAATPTFNCGTGCNSGGGAVTNAGAFAVQLTGAANNLNNISGTITLPTGAATAANQATNAATTVHTCATSGFSEIGCLGQIDDDIKAPLAAGTNLIGSVIISSGFRPAVYGTPIAATTSGVTGTLPAGSEVVATNVGTANGVYCSLGASATTSSQYIAPNGGWFAFGISGDTQLTCITSTGTTAVNMAGGAGLPTGMGGGGGVADVSRAFSITSSTPAGTQIALAGTNSVQVSLTGTWVAGVIGQISNDNVTWTNVPLLNLNVTPPVYIAANSGAVTNGNYLFVGTQGALFARIFVTYTSGTVVGTMTASSQGPSVTFGDYVNNLQLISLNATAAASVAAGPNTIGNTGSDPSSGKSTPAEKFLALPATTTTQIIALSGTTSTYITSALIMAGGTVNVTFKYGTGTNCGTGTTTLNGPWPLTAQAGFSKGSGVGAVMIVPAGQALCITTDASVSGGVDLTYQQI